MKHEALRAMLRRWGSDEGPYDFNGVVHLLLACLDNLKAFALDAELEDIGESFDTEQAAFLGNLARRVEVVAAPRRVTFSAAWFPVQAFFNAISDDRFVEVIGHLARGNGAGIDVCHCFFSGDAEPDDAPWAGVEFSIFEERVVLSYAQFFYALGVVCGAQRARCPEQAAELDAIICALPSTWPPVEPPAGRG